MWIGTMNGLCKYNAKEDQFELIPLDIPSSNICAIIEDQRVLWLTTTKGLVRYTPEESCGIYTKRRIAKRAVSGECCFESFRWEKSTLVL